MEPSPSPSERRFGALALVALSISLTLNWAMSSLVLWLAYDIEAQIIGGRYQRGQALTLVAKMALIITILTYVVWLFADWKKTKRQGWWWRGWSITWKTWVLLTLYVAIVLIRRNLWQPSQGINAYAMFLPIVGHVNGQFLSESLWVVFIMQVIPFVGLISGGLYLLRHWIGAQTAASAGGGPF